MERSLLTTFRHASTFLRATAGLVLLTFGVMVTSPAVAAIKEAKPAPRAAAQQPDPDEKKLSKAILDIEERVRRLVEKLERKQDAASERGEIRQLEQSVRKLDTAVLKNFAELERHIKDKQLPDIILARHTDAVNSFQRERDELLNRLAALLGATSEQGELDAAKQLKGWLASKKLQRAHQPFDPNNLPFQPQQPNRNNVPKTKKEQYAAAGLISQPLAKTAALGSFDYSQLADASDPAYLAQNTEVQLTDALKAKAQELNGDPIAILQWVRNQVEWLPSWGAMQDSDLTLSSRRGNAMDIASLTIALLRASGIPARYVHGVIDVPADAFRNWAGGFNDLYAAMDFASAGGIPLQSVTSGGKVTHVRLEHIWVEAAIDYIPSRGVKNYAADSWVAMDASFKQYEFLTGLDVVSLSGINPEQLAQQFASSGTVNEAEGWVQGLNPTVLESAQTQAKTALDTWLAQHPNATVGDVIGGRKVIVKEFPVLPSSLPNRIVVRATHYGEMPNPLRAHIAFGFGTDSEGNLSGEVSYPWAALNNRKVTLSFKPATAADEQALASLIPPDITDVTQLPTSIPSYLLYVVPELKVDGQTVLTGTSMRLGEDLPFAFRVTDLSMGVRTYPSPVVAGSYLSVAVVGGSVASAKLEAVEGNLDSAKNTLESQNQALIAGLTRDDILGDIFHAGTLGYFAEFHALANLFALSKQSHMNLATSAGTYGYAPEVTYFFSIPRSISPGGAEMDLDRVAFARSVDGNSTNAAFHFTFQLGALSSALEHAVPEQMFVTPENPGEAVSAVKALQKAAQQGQRTYHITQANLAATLPNIHQNLLATDEIRHALAVGQEVIAHTDPISVPGWRGSGYVIYDPDTGAAAWKISGGLSGGWMFWGTVAVLIAVIIVTGRTGNLFFTALALAAYKSFLDRVKIIAATSKTSEEAYERLNELCAVTLAAVLGSQLLRLLDPHGLAPGVFLAGFTWAFGKVAFE